MITSSAQAERIQKRRYESGKRGYAKAVRRFYLAATEHMQQRWEIYTGRIGRLPHRF